MRHPALLLVPPAALGALLAFRPAPAPACDPDNGGLVLPKGFCATVFASVPGVRHIVVAPNGDVFAGNTRTRGVTAFRDRQGTGHADTSVVFGDSFGAGTGVALGADAIYFAPNDRVIRFSWKPGSLTPIDAGTVIVSGMPATGNHVAKTLAVTKDGFIFVDHGSASNACQEVDRNLKSPGKQPCPELPIRAGTWRYSATKPNQAPGDGERWTTGVRNGMAIAIEPTTGVLWGATHGRDDVARALGGSAEDNAEKPAEEFGVFDKGADYGWPYCYYDPLVHRKLQAPEYGGDGVKQGDCAAKTQPVIAFPAHWAPMELAFVPAKNAFGAGYGAGAFLAFHGSWDRAPLPQAGFRVVFIPFKNGKAVGSYSTFADGTDHQFKIGGVAMAPDGSALYIASDPAGKIWRVVPTTSR